MEVQTPTPRKHMVSHRGTPIPTTPKVLVIRNQGNHNLIRYSISKTVPVPKITSMSQILMKFPVVKSICHYIFHFGIEIICLYYIPKANARLEHNPLYRYRPDKRFDIDIPSGHAHLTIRMRVTETADTNGESIVDHVVWFVENTELSGKTKYSARFINIVVNLEAAVFYINI